MNKINERKCENVDTRGLFHTEPMQKIRIISLLDYKYNVISALHKLGVLDIKKSQLKLDEDSVFEKINIISERLIKIKSAQYILKKPEKENIKKITHASLNDAIKLSENESTNKLLNNIFTLSEQIKDLEEKLSEIVNVKENLSLFTDTKINFNILNSSNLDFEAIKAERNKYNLICEELKKSKLNYEIITKEISKNLYLIFIAFGKNDKQKIENIINNYVQNRIDINRHYFLEGTAEQILKKIYKEEKETKSKIDNAKKMLDSISNKYYYYIAALREMLEIEYDRAKISEMFKRTNKTFVLEGWVPKKEFINLNDTLKNITNNNYYLEEIKTDELAPTKLTRTGIFKSFDYLMEFYSLPRSDEIDPTWIFIFSFAIFYGLMISDIGYGLLSLIISLLILRKVDKDGLVYNVAIVWGLSSISVIFFGLLSNQIFGYSVAMLNPIQILNWNKNIPSIISLSIMIGIFYVILGQIISFINKYKHHEKKLAISKLISIITVITGTIAISGFLFNTFNLQISEISAIIAIITLLITVVMSGREAVELSNLISHPLSFSRILGFGLASIIIASLIDKAFTPSLGSGSIINIILFIIFLIFLLILHVLNTILGMFEGIVQGARLNFVEFFSKFYSGNGIKFKPFKFKRYYTKEKNNL
ncbi:MAG: V-type ATP synthase subunit I [Candidatus Micrarchaeia archaeon]